MRRCGRPHKPTEVMCTRMEILEVGADTIRAYIELNEFAACIIITKNITYFISLKANNAYKLLFYNL